LITLDKMKSNQKVQMKNLAFCMLFILVANLLAVGQSLVRFCVTDVPVSVDQKVGIRGNIAPLDWTKSKVLKKEGHYFVIDLDFSEGENELEFKFVLFSDDKNPTWENTQNRSLTLQESQVSNNVWNKEQSININDLDKIDSIDLKEDFELIENMILQVHPGTYRYNSKEEIREGLEELKKVFSQSVSYQEAYLAISKLTAQLKCEHTTAGFNNQGKVINSIIHYQPDKVPFTFKWIDDQMIVVLNASENSSLKRGTTVLAINGVSSVDIRNDLLEFVGADGATDGNRISKLEVDGYDFRYNAFDIFYPLVFPFDSKMKLEIQESPNEVSEIIEVKSLTQEDRANKLKERYSEFPKSRDDLWNVNYLNDSTAVLELNSFGLYGWKALQLDYNMFLKNSFKQFKDDSIDHLIIDIRKNLGGNDEIAKELFSYLTEYSADFDREGRTRYIEFPESLKPHIKTWGDTPWYYNLKPKNSKPENGYYIFKENFSQAQERSDKEIYDGKIYLLTSAANTSLAFYTAYRFRLQELGMIIGQETGGNLNDINGGQILFMQLPNSKIEIDFPVMGGFTIEPQADKGIDPDLEIHYSIEDIRNNRDNEIDAVLKIIEGKN